MTSRLLLLTLLGIVPVMLVPGWTSALIVAGVIAVVAFVDWRLAPAPRLIGLQRTPGPMVR